MNEQPHKDRMPQLALSARRHETAPHPEAKQALSDARAPTAPRIRSSCRTSVPSVESRWAVLRQHTDATDADQRALMDPRTIETMSTYARNIEIFIGTVAVPVGICGPLRVNGKYAQGDYFLPLATTEAALVASYARGASLLTRSGGCRTTLLDERIGRAPAFVFDNIREVEAFVAWVKGQHNALGRVARSTTRYGRLVKIASVVNGNHVILLLEYKTGDAAGQNMITIATEAICDFICEQSPITPKTVLIECNYSGDKKASARSLIGGRGRRVTAEAVIARDLVRQFLKATPTQIAAFWRDAVLGSIMSGSVGLQGQFANGLAALFLATGQDVACVAESALGITRLEETERGDLYAAVTLPSLAVGTVGGGTGLRTQAACLRIANSFGPGNARAFAELCGALCLAGELSLTAAIAADQFARAHRRRARGQRETPASR